MQIEQPTGKAYLYALRAVCSMQHAADQKTPPPVQFQEFLPTLDDEIREQVEELLVWKEKYGEKDSPGRLPVLDSFLTERLETVGLELDAMPQRKVSHDDFNAILHRWTLWPS